MSLRFAVEPLSSCYPEVDALGRAHWKETEGYRHGQLYNPDWKRYFSNDAAGWYFMCTARPWNSCVVQTPMVGYAGMYVMPSMHTQQPVASEDTFFLLEDYRKGWNAIKFIRFIEAQCRKRGAIEIGWSDKKGKGRLLEYLGYEVVASQYSKQFLGGADSTHAKLNAVEAVDVRSKFPTPA